MKRGIYGSISFYGKNRNFLIFKVYQINNTYGQTSTSGKIWVEW